MHELLSLGAPRLARSSPIASRGSRSGCDEDNPRALLASPTSNVNPGFYGLECSISLSVSVVSLDEVGPENKVMDLAGLARVLLTVVGLLQSRYQVGL